MSSSQGSASGTGFPGSRSPGPGNLEPGLILISRTGTGTQVQNFRDLKLGPGLKFEKSGTRDWDRDALKIPEPEPGLTMFSSGTEILSNHGCVPGTENFPRNGPGPVPTLGSNSGFVHYLRAELCY